MKKVVAFILALVLAIGLGVFASHKIADPGTGGWIPSSPAQPTADPGTGGWIPVSTPTSPTL